MAVTSAPSSRIAEAQNIGKTDPSKAEAIYKDILSKKPGGSEAALREYESALVGLGESYRDTRKTNELAELVRSSTSSLSSFTKAKTAKLGVHNNASVILLLLLTKHSPSAPRPLLLNPKYR